MSAGMLLVSNGEWKYKLKEKLNEACTDKNTLKGEEFQQIYKSVEEAGKATCLVLRGARSCRRGGCGTGLLIVPKSKYGWLY